MFTAEQINAAHSKVKSGADFPAYIKAIKSLGVTHYETYVGDGHTDYHGANNHSVTISANYEPLQIAKLPHIDVFKQELLAHQQGKTDYPTFIKMCASLGVKKWEINLDKLTCTYFDSTEAPILVEIIPQ